MNAEFKHRRDVFVAGLNKIKGFSCRVPKGAFYTFPNITKTGWPSKKLADALLEEAGVACLSGTAFGEYGEGYLRFSVANSLENLNKALARIEDWVGKNLRLIKWSAGRLFPSTRLLDGRDVRRSNFISR